MKLSAGNYKDLLKTAVGKLKTFPWDLGRHVFLCILMFILLDLLVGEALFYKYVYLARTQTPPAPAVSTKFNEKAYQFVIGHWEAGRERGFSSQIKNNNPFE